MKKYTRGFTLIELLVVIAIIGILSSVVLVSLNSARQKGSDSKITTEVAQVRTQLETEYDGSAYTKLINHATVAKSDAVYSTSANVTALATDIIKQAGGTGATDVTRFSIKGAGAVGVAASGYSIYGKTNAGYFCVSSSGNTITNTSAGAIPVGAATDATVCQ